MRRHGWRNKYKIIKQAIDNEISIDENLVKKLSLKRGIAVFKVGRFKDKISLLLSVLLLPAVPFYYLVQIWISLKDKSYPITENKTALFLSFSRSPKISELYNTYAADLPYVQCVFGSKLHFIKHLSFIQLVTGYFVALIFSLRFIITSHPRYYLHSLNVFELVLFFLFLEKLKIQDVSALTLTNHYDRWITLITQCQLFEVNVIQHGIIDEEYRPKHKLKNIKTVRVFDNKQLNLFNQNIFDSNLNEVFYIKPNLNVDQSDQCEILIISNPFFIDTELKIYNQLKSKKHDVKFRPHPLYLNDEIKKTINETDLCLGSRLPAPKICICRSSTLGNEYEMMGYKVIWWNENSTVEDIMVAVRG